MKNSIKEIRKTLGITQLEMSKQLGVSRQTINCIENDKYNPTLELAMQIAKFLDTTVENLFSLE